MSTATFDGTRTVRVDDLTGTPVVALKRRTIDSVLISFGVVALAVFAVAGGLLTWGHNFSSDYVKRELGSQHISFPAAADLKTEGRADLAKWGGHAVDTGAEAQAYASYINGHLAKIGGGLTYAEMKTPLDAANAAVKAAQTSGAPAATITDLQAKATAVAGARTTMFQGETLRGLLLSAYAWSTVGSIAGIAAFGAFAAAGLMLVLVVLGMFHHRKAVKNS